MSKTRELARSEWDRSLKELGGREAKHPVHIEVIGREIGDETLTRTLPLLGISVESKGADRDTVDLLVGREGGTGTLDHRIAGVERIAVLESDDGELECLSIEDRDGKTLIRFD